MTSKKKFGMKLNLVNCVSDILFLTFIQFLIHFFEGAGKNSKMDTTV